MGEIQTDFNELHTFSDYLIGRESELTGFRNFLAIDQLRVMNIYGQAGIGKTYLLNVLEQLSLNDGDIFIRMDSSDFNHTPHDFIAHVNLSLGSYTQPMTETNPTIFDLKIKLAQLLQSSRVIIAIDTYENMADLDRWIRQFFLIHTDPSIKIIITGRHRLSGEWVESPIWRAQVQHNPLNFFTKKEITLFLNQRNIEDESMIKTLHDFTEGHPLALALACLSFQEQEDSADFRSTEIQHVLLELTKRWLSEVSNDDILNLIEAAAMFKQFNQHSLSVVLEREISYENFIELTSLSFVQKNQNNWNFHELIQDSIKVDLLQRSPEKFAYFKGKVVGYYQKRLIQTRNLDDIAMFFYHIGDDLIQSVFFHSKTIDKNRFYIELVDDYNFPDVICFFEKIKHDVGVSKTAFYNRVSNQTFHFFASSEHNLKELKLIGPDYIQLMGLDSTKLLRDYSGNLHAISVVVPVHKGTIDHLSKQPVSRAYFNQLTDGEWKKLQCPKEDAGAYFIRFLDFVDPSDTDARIALMYDLLPLLLTGAKIIVSSPLPFFQELVKSFGFIEIPRALHYDYGETSPSPTYELDLSGARLIEYMSHLSKDLSQTNQYKMISDYLNLTVREGEILKLIIEGNTNTEIGKQLYVAEITVKKHISRIFKKAGVKNRAQLVKKVMENI
ncbi:LuxR C-terminal-related transcriptional regulator [Salipaludibacillus sp. HK11]|uniref:LuxR C-terminal-related transcriptional regulator n=1 Tax=Salipaludibacillus sp. HK11 TaxID=3394320 RepID=UPI0039FC93EA